ncbi:MAG TPA: hypothetical protein ENN67_08895, partial [Firmicutes bacterium]|nr:hypothetical protein [Bacillota bacterium]
MAQEFPVVPNGGNDEKIFPFPEQQDDGKAEKAKDGIRRLSEARLSADAPLARLKGYIEVLKSRIRAVIDSEKLIRVERARLSIKLNELKKRHLELQRLRLKKNSEHLEISGKIRALKNGSDAQNGDELSRLESRLKELEDDLSAFSETLTMHRRDRDRVFEKLAESNQRLQ